MKLFKNVDICDLQKILSEGILPVNVTGNDNWWDGRNTTDPSLVYLFAAHNTGDSFPASYGTALLEVEVDDAVQNAMSPRDIHRHDYTEYVTGSVPADRIRSVYIPEIFRDRMPYEDSRITFCGMSCEVYDSSIRGFRPATAEEVELFGNTAPFADTKAFNFFRGSNPDRTMLDVYNIKYDI